MKWSLTKTTTRLKGESWSKLTTSALGWSRVWNGTGVSQQVFMINRPLSWRHPTASRRHRFSQTPSLTSVKFRMKKKKVSKKVFNFISFDFVNIECLEIKNEHRVRSKHFLDLRTVFWKWFIILINIPTYSLESLTVWVRSRFGSAFDTIFHSDTRSTYRPECHLRSLLTPDRLQIHRSTSV